MTMIMITNHLYKVICGLLNCAIADNLE